MLLNIETKEEDTEINSELFLNVINSLSGVVAGVLTCNIISSVFDLQSLVHFLTNTFEKGMNFCIHSLAFG